MLKHMISVSQFTPDLIDKIFACAYKAKHVSSDALRGKVLASLFYEPSTRTFASFYSAMTSMGGSVIPINEVQYSSVTKGESLSDTIKTLACYSDAIVLRHPEDDAAERAAKISSVPIINAGCGSNEHPTQALLDLYTINNELGHLNGLIVTFMGDNKFSRTVHSLVRLLRWYDIKINFVGPLQISPPLCHMKAGDESYEDLHDCIQETDVLYVTRPQKERYESTINADYFLRADDLLDAKKEMIVMHPFPRVGEIDKDIDSDIRACYFRQIQNGLYIRRAILALMIQ